jgi:sucrose-6-phosphate hydrolase SacC (GH32 family)
MHMLVGAALETGGGVAYYTLESNSSPVRWQMKAHFTEPGVRALDPGSDIWEMPVFQQLSDDIWVLLVNPIGGRFSKYGDHATRAMYWTGRWADGLFKPFDSEPKMLDLVPGHLAPTVARAVDGDLRAIGIIDERRTPAAQLRAGWAHTFSLPRVWSLRPDQRTLGQSPAPELRTLRGEVLKSADRMPIGVAPTLLAQGLNAYEVQIDLADWPADGGALAVDLMASEGDREVTRLMFDRTNGRVTVDLSRSTLSGEREGPPVLTGTYDARAFGAMNRVRLFVDGSVVEVFINDAAAYGIRSYPSLPQSTQVRLSSAGRTPLAADVRLWPLRAASP